MRKSFNLSVYDDERRRVADADVIFPDEVVFAYNPLYIDVQVKNWSRTINSLTLSVGACAPDKSNYSGFRKINVDLYDGHARVYISRILQLFYTEAIYERSMRFAVSMCLGEERCEDFFTTSLVGIWGNIALGERFNAYGMFKFDKDVPYMHRTRIWFKNFPFTVTMFAWDNEGNGFMAKKDGGVYDNNLLCYIFPPKVDGVLNELNDDIDLEGYLPGSDYNAQEIEGVFYIKELDRFLARDSNHIYYDDWTNEYETYGYPGCDAYNSGTGNIAKALKGQMFMFGSRFAYVGDGELITLPYGCVRKKGLFELVPAYTFPEALVSATYKQPGKPGASSYSVFDTTFDYTFFSGNMFSVITTLRISNETSGYYLRWIDNFGCINYYLFTKGKQTIKNKLASDQVAELDARGGMWFNDLNRNISVETTTTNKGCAVSMPQEVWDYVATIVKSPIVDMYLGKTKSGEEIWVPVNIVGENHTYNPTELLHDLELSFTLPVHNSQSL